MVELLETVQPDEEVLQACRTLKAAGYTLALDDFVDVINFVRHTGTPGKTHAQAQAKAFAAPGKVTVDVIGCLLCERDTHDEPCVTM